jgi:hypothetical protein
MQHNKPKKDFLRPAGGKVKSAIIAVCNDASSQYFAMVESGALYREDDFKKLG